MDPLMQFFTWQFMLFSLSVAGVTFVLRLVVEYFIKKAQTLKLWEELILPIFPLAFGSTMGWLMVKYPYPDGLVTVGGRVIFGLVAGMFSGFVYRTIKSLLNAKGNPTDPTVILDPVPNPLPLPLPPPVQMDGISQNLIDSVRDSIKK